jgi:DNA-binding MarR family transcriptional regulator
MRPNVSVEVIRNVLLLCFDRKYEGSRHFPVWSTVSTATTSKADLVETTIRVGRHLEAELEEILGTHRLSLQSYYVLSALALAPERTLTQKELVSAAGRTSGTTSVRLNRLARAGLIERVKDPEDGRAVRVTLTDRGARLVERAVETYTERASQLTAGLNDGAPDVTAALTGWLEFFSPAQRSAPRLGVAVAPAAVANRMRRAVGLASTNGLLVLGVEPDSPAAAAGLDQGDLIQAVSGEPVHSTGDLERALAQAPGHATIGVLRGADARDVEVSFP